MDNRTTLSQFHDNAGQCRPLIAIVNGRGVYGWEASHVIGQYVSLAAQDLADAFDRSPPGQTSKQKT